MSKHKEGEVLFSRESPVFHDEQLLNYHDVLYERWNLKGLENGKDENHYFFLKSLIGNYPHYMEGNPPLDYIQSLSKYSSAEQCHALLGDLLRLLKMKRPTL